MFFFVNLILLKATPKQCFMHFTSNCKSIIPWFMVNSFTNPKFKFFFYIFVLQMLNSRIMSLNSIRFYANKVILKILLLHLKDKKILFSSHSLYSNVKWANCKFILKNATHQNLKKRSKYIYQS